MIEAARLRRETVIQNITGFKKVVSMHHDISTVMGEEMVAYPERSPRFSRGETKAAVPEMAALIA